MNAHLSTLIRFSLLCISFTILPGCGNHSDTSNNKQEPESQAVGELLGDGITIRPITAEDRERQAEIERIQAEIEQQCNPHGRNQELRGGSGPDGYSHAQNSSSDISQSSPKESEQTNDLQDSETTETVVEAPKFDPDELMREALEHLAEKRRARQESESAAEKATEEALSESRNNMVKEIVSELVKIPGRSFKMGRTEVTQSQWEGVMGSNPSYFKYSDHPVDSVSWYDAQAFIKTLNDHPVVKESGIVFRLPTPDEWEYACRAGSRGNFGLLPSGQEGNAESMAWYLPNTGNGGMTRPVGKKSPNAWGLYDMHGNVQEWTSVINFDYGETKGGSYAGWEYDVTAKSKWELARRNEKYRSVGIRLCADGD